MPLTSGPIVLGTSADSGNSGGGGGPAREGREDLLEPIVLGSWFAWNLAASTQIPEFSAGKMLYGFHTDGPDAPQDPDDAMEHICAASTKLWDFYTQQLPDSSLCGHCASVQSLLVCGHLQSLRERDPRT